MLKLRVIFELGCKEEIGPEGGIDRTVADDCDDVVTEVEIWDAAPVPLFERTTWREFA